MNSTIFLENEYSAVLPLNGLWEFKLGAGPARTIPVPSAWEAHVADKLTDGPALYRRTFTLPESWPRDATIVLEADAISFDADVRLNGEPIGRHQGIWSPFQLDITPWVRAGKNVIEIEVWKPGGRFPLRETLAGFLPDVATTFGGIWQGIRIRAFSGAALSDVRVCTRCGRLEVQGRVVRLGEERPYEIWVEVLDNADRAPARTRADLADDQTFSARLELEQVRPWTLQPDAALYFMRIDLRAHDAEIARATRRVGFRDIGVEDDRVLLNNAPLHVRGVLDWGWDAARLCPTTSRPEAFENFAKARALGFNAFKLCLFVPDETLFDAADEAGLLLWLEMPLWLPNVTPALRELALREYRDVFRRLHHHPSIAIVSLGCELNAQADADFLAALDRLAREWFPNALHCDNSGSAEAYGGVPTSLSDFYDYHFYTDPHFFRPLVRHFHRPYRAAKPWIFGEFCDADTLRDFSKLDPEPWWLTEPTALDRDDFLATRDYKARLRRANVTDGGAALTEAARKQATAVRKYILEQVRAESASGGYIVTGWVDTPITTSGIADDRRVLKFNGEEWRQFNNDRVLIMDRGRRRRWAGGDRPTYHDPHVWRAGETAEIYLALSNGGPAVEGARLGWRLMSSSGQEIAGGETVVSVAGGTLSEVAVFHARMPLSKTLIELHLTATLTDERRSEVISQNFWKLWVAPRVSLEPMSGRLVHELNDTAVARARAGESILVWLKAPDPRFSRDLPFWREAIHVFEGHPLWERVPHPGYADMRFFSVATDFALNLDRLAATLGPGTDLRPVWRRFDARQLFWSEYIVEARLGAGKLTLTTLRFAGGLGIQPDTLDTNPMGAWLLHSLLQFT